MESEYYLNLLKALIPKTERYFNIDFDTALPIVLNVFSEINKDRRVAEMLKRKQSITAKQLFFLRKLGITVEPDISKEEASKLIEEHLRNNNNNSNNYRNAKGRLATALSFPK